MDRGAEMIQQATGQRHLEHLDLDVSTKDHVLPGHFACAGCGAVRPIDYALRVLGPKTVAVISACCWSGIGAALTIPNTDCAFMSGGSWATGVKQGLETIGDFETKVLVIAGDGGTFDIGIQSLSAAAERNEDFIYICYDNEGYQNTGNQRSSATPFGASTFTSAKKQQFKKDILAIMAAHRIPYAASAVVGYPRDLMRKMAKAKAIKGMRFIHCLATCPTGWRFAPDRGVQISRLAVQSLTFPLYEVEDGIKYTVQRPAKTVPVREYVKAQGRFSTVTDKEIELIQSFASDNWERLLKKADVVEALPY